MAHGTVKAEFGLSAQSAVRAVKKVVDDYATLRANIRAGNLGRPGSRHRASEDVNARSSTLCHTW
ncbi:hypothetical protein ABH930_004497 [Kitasatospora sp. GAS204A]|nr:hypothetical protein [Kitasatospora sp. GAS204B]